MNGETANAWLIVGRFRFGLLGKPPAMEEEE
jgi:hypothetical protein